MKVLIKGGTVYDGSGAPGIPADVLVAGGRIEAVGPGLEAGGGRVVDAIGLAVAPGFIDPHTHSDRTILRVPLGNSKVMQGVTTEVAGNCGIGPFPVSRERRRDLESYLENIEGSLPPGGIAWDDFDGFAVTVAKAGPGINLACLVPHGALRIAAMGPADRPPTEAELAAMKRLLAAALAQGAYGMSTGLIYPPGSYAATAELTELSGVLAGYGALYTSHVRGESAGLLTAVDEAVAIVRESGARGMVSHLKAIGRPNWGQALTALARLEAARRDGVAIWADQYPYEATSTTLTALLPGWVMDGGPEAMLLRLADPGLGEKIKQAVAAEMAVRGGPERVRIATVRTESGQRFVGLTVAEVAARRGLRAEEMVVKLLAEEGGAVGAVFFSLSREDLEGIIKSDIVAVGSDGQVMDPARDGHHMVHPRSYGTFPRVLGRYVREQGLLPLEAAIRKMTGLPAAILGLEDRGLLRPGNRADITVFDPARIIDRADFSAPHQYPDGIAHVFVNGTPAVADGRLTGDGRGEVLRRGR